MAGYQTNSQWRSVLSTVNICEKLADKDLFFIQNIGIYSIQRMINSLRHFLQEF